MCVCLYVCLHLFMYICMWLCVYVYLYVPLHVCKWHVARTLTCTHTHISACMHGMTRLNARIHTHTDTHALTHKHTHTHTSHSQLPCPWAQLAISPASFAIIV